MELNYEKRYAFAEVETILKWLGEEYINKLPKRILRAIKEQKKFAYTPEIDFNKPIENQIRQETKNIIAYFELNFWLEDENKKQLIRNAIKENAKREKEKKRLERLKEIELRAKNDNSKTLTESINNSLRNINK
ncbi:MAG: hypothetical protein J6C46_04635 [Clostridia bacterium]|nr:hypothetical protein [Clostridia bacterium]